MPHFGPETHALNKKTPSKHTFAKCSSQNVLPFLYPRVFYARTRHRNELLSWAQAPGAPYGSIPLDAATLKHSGNMGDMHDAGKAVIQVILLSLTLKVKYLLWLKISKHVEYSSSMQSSVFMHSLHLLRFYTLMAYSFLIFSPTVFHVASCGRLIQHKPKIHTVLRSH